ELQANDGRLSTGNYIERIAMRIITPSEVAKQAGNKYLGVLVAAKFARYLNEFPKDHLARPSEKLTTKALQELVEGELNYKLLRRRRSEA
ncbi:MAG TPA: DNA-directed RNA polymerase subunit omega, partial [Gemmatimonadales bacterium]|nr:DNA-directed RNA polymerase subunit omega [Gemmatimonadales bacterium]